MMFEKLKSWKDQGYFAYYGAGWNDNQKPFEENKVALWIGSSGSFGGLQKTAQSCLSRQRSCPTGRNQGRWHQLLHRGAALFAMSGKPEAENKCVADFFQFLTSPEFRSSTMKQPATWPSPRQLMSWQRRKAITRSSLLPKSASSSCRFQAGVWSKGYRLGFYPQIRAIMEREYGRIFSGEVS